MQISRVAGNGALVATILVGLLVACARGQRPFVLKQGGESNLLVVEGRRGPLAQFEAASTYVFFLASHNGKQCLVRESYTADKSTVVVFLDPGATYSKAVYFSVDMIGSRDTGKMLWFGVEIQFESPRVVQEGMWDELLSEFERLLPGSGWKPEYGAAGTVIPTAVYLSGTKTGEVAYISPSSELSRIEIEYLKRVGGF